MTLIGAILKKVKSKDSVNKYRGYISPPPELDDTSIERRIGKKKKKTVDKFAHVVPRVDSAPPRLCPRYMYRNLETYHRQLKDVYMDNVKLVMAIKKQHLMGGLVDCHWKHAPQRSYRQFVERQSRLKRVEADNKEMYRMIVTAKPRVVQTKSLLQDWSHNRQKIIQRAEKPFILFPVVSEQCIEDPAFVAPDGVKRPRVYLSLRLKNGASLGELCVELFSDVCPLTTQLFLELLLGDGLGHSYVQTCFFRKVPRLYWSGGDVIYDNGFGCYAQRGRSVPIAAENYHFSHSMPGLLSMRMTCNDEMCGIFNITFKPLRQFDLKNVVFGRVIRPSSAFSTIQTLGNPLGSQPVVQISATRVRHRGGWLAGQPNTKLPSHPNRLKAFLTPEQIKEFYG